MQSIFDEFSRIDWEIKRYPESNYDFLNKSAWPLADLARTTINRLVRSIGDDVELWAMIKSKSDKQHDAAMFEVLLFNLLKNSHLPIVKNDISGNSKTPDFTISLAQQLIHLECTSAGSAIETVYEHRKKASVSDIIENLPDFPYYVNIVFNRLSDKTISKRSFLRFIKDFGTKQAHLSTGEVSFPAFYQEDGWDLEITLTGKSADICRTRGVEFPPMQIIDNFSPLFTALNNKKPSRYGINNDAYIVCLHVDDITAHDDEFSQVLFGMYNRTPVNTGLKTSGYFLNNGTGHNTSVSAVMFCKNLKIFGLTTTAITLWHNPFATFPVTQGVLPVTEVVYEIRGDFLQQQIFEKEINVFRLLDIDEQSYRDGLRMENRRSR